MAKFIHQVANLESEIKGLKLGLFGVVVVGIVAMYFVKRVPHEIALHIAPNMRAADVVAVTDGVAPVPKPNVYGFGYYMWQQVNRWSRDGNKDYGAQVFALQNYLTPRCQEWLKQDITAKSRAGELAGRTRSMSEIAGHAYSDARVIPEGDNAWTVFLDLHAVETVKGQIVKETGLRYPLRVVRYDIDINRNPWRLAVDCNHGTVADRLALPDTAVAVASKDGPAGAQGAPAAGAAVPTLPKLPASAPVAPLPELAEPQ